MRKLKEVLSIASLCIVAILWIGGTLSAQDVSPGVDLWITPPTGNTYMNFIYTPIPADFFGPGSDPFNGVIPLQGEPLNTSPPDILGPTDTIVERIESAALPACGASDPVQIELIALSLVSIGPMTVTYNGGQNPESWDVQICLSSSVSQDPGSMTITKGCDEGGTFTAELRVIPKFTFSKVANPQDQRVFDFGSEGVPSIPLVTSDGHWLYSDPGFGIITSPGALTADHDCDGSADISVGASSNFFPGLQGLPCDCSNNPTEHNIVMTYFENQSLIAGQGVLPPQGGGGAGIEPGFDLWVTPEDGNTSIELGCPDIPPIPADFFGPGSDPFTGTVDLIGEPLTTIPDNVLGPTDTIIERKEFALLPECPSVATVDIEIVALSLVSVNPIIVTFNGGQDPQNWDVKVCLSSQPQQTGSMTISQNCTEGGTFDALLPVLPLLIFTQLDPPYNQLGLDFGLEGIDPIPLITVDEHWLYSDPEFDVITSPGGVLADNCGDAPSIPVGQSGVDFFPGLQADPCNNCIDPPTDYFMPITSLADPGCATLEIQPPQSVIESIPTLSEWGMLIMGLLLLAIGTVTVVRKRKVALSKSV